MSYEHGRGNPNIYITNALQARKCVDITHITQISLQIKMRYNDIRGLWLLIQRNCTKVQSFNLSDVVLNFNKML